MPYQVMISTPVVLLDFTRRELRTADLLAQLDGLVCHDDTVLNYLEAEIRPAVKLSGGFPRLELEPSGKRLRLMIEIGVSEKLNRQELKSLADDLIGQISDGIGSGCFNELSDETTLTVTYKQPLRLRTAQTEGKVKLPGKGAEKANQRKYRAINRWITQQDKSATPPASNRKKAPSGSKLPPEGKSAPGGKANLQPLLRLLSKVDRDSRLEEIKAALNKAGGDVSGLADRELPYLNWTSLPLFKLMMNAGLNPELLDVKGFTMLHRAAGNAGCVKLLLAQGVDVNRHSEDVYRETALMRAAFLGNTEVIELLLAAGADPNAQGDFGHTPLNQIHRLTRQPEKVTAMLIAAGATSDSVAK